jgi:uncharacterized membrane protein
MAGIGFRLQKFVNHGSYTYNLRGFLFATFLVAGPWITTILVISLFSYFSTLDGLEYDIFRTTIIYFYAFSLILTGIYQMPVTRYLADELFSERLKSLVPAYLGMIVLVCIVQGAVSIIYSMFIPLSLLYRVLFLSGSVVVALLWLAGIFLSCLRDFEFIGWIYIIGGLLSLACGIHLEPYYGLEGALAGFILGQLFTWAGISWRIFTELGRGTMQANFESIKSLKHYKIHLFVGLFFNIGIWIDKFQFWFSDFGQSAVQGLNYYLPYDVPIFLAYVCVIPGLGIFLTRVETDFYLSYRDFYGAILERKTLKTIISKYKDILRTIKYTSWELIRIQGSITLIIFFFAPEFLRLIHYPIELAQVLRWGILGSFFQVLFLVYSLMLLYFEFKKEALYSNLVFLVINGLITGISIHYQTNWTYGAGYFFSTISAAFTAKILLNLRLKKLLYVTFMTERMPGEVIDKQKIAQRARGITAFIKKETEYK